MSTNHLAEKARLLFEKTFSPGGCELTTVFAPGRVNLIGEHTDYNGGFVMPLALERQTVIVGRAELTPKSEGRKECRIVSDHAEGGTVSFFADQSLKPGEPFWSNYVKGVVFEFLQDVPGSSYLSFDAAIVSNVPLGGGLSSSAALEVSTALFLSKVIGRDIDRKTLALRCQSAEHNFANTPCGIMDQFVSAMAKKDHALLIDCKSYNTQAIPLDDPDVVVLVTNSNVKHSLSDGEYGRRAQQCLQAVKAISAKHPGVELLRDAQRDWVEEIKGEVSDVVYRRARHIKSEDARTEGAAEALKRHDYKTVGLHMVNSHNSLRDDYEVSCKELDFLVEVAMRQEGVYGSRMTGGGFGGCTVTLVRKDAVGRLIRALNNEYTQRFGLECTCFATKAGPGAEELDAVDSTTRRRRKVVLGVTVLLAAAGLALYLIPSRRKALK